MNKMEKPLVSIVIPVYNGSNYVAQAIDSALRQSYENIEIIVVNDGSEDNGKTDETVRSYGDKVRYISKENGGSSSALNAGINNMKGEWFSWLSHDDLYYDNKVERQIEFLNSLCLDKQQEYKHIFFTAADYINSEGGYIKKADENKERLIKEYIDAIPGNEYLICEPTRFNFYGCGCLIHKKALSQAGLFDEGLRLINDLDMWYRLYEKGFHLHYMPESLVMGRLHSAQISRSIGFSYHNSEQDMFWERSLDYLKTNCSNNYQVFHLFGRNALNKTRTQQGKEAFGICMSLDKKKKLPLMAEMQYLRLKAAIRTILKKIYMKVFMK